MMRMRDNIRCIEMQTKYTNNERQNKSVHVIHRDPVPIFNISIRCLRRSGEYPCHIDVLEQYNLKNGYCMNFLYLKIYIYVNESNTIHSLCCTTLCVIWIVEFMWKLCCVIGKKLMENAYESHFIWFSAKRKLKKKRRKTKRFYWHRWIWAIEM